MQNCKKIIQMESPEALLREYYSITEEGLDSDDIDL